jgi:hypothetical protein
VTTVVDRRLKGLRKGKQFSDTVAIYRILEDATHRDPAHGRAEGTGSNPSFIRIHLRNSAISRTISPFSLDNPQLFNA